MHVCSLAHLCGTLVNCTNHLQVMQSNQTWSMPLKDRLYLPRPCTNQAALGHGLPGCPISAHHPYHLDNTHHVHAWRQSYKASLQRASPQRCQAFGTSNKGMGMSHVRHRLLLRASVP